MPPLNVEQRISNHTNLPVIRATLVQIGDVLAAYDSGKYTLKQIAEQFQVTTRWIQKLRQQRDQESSIAPRPQNQGRKPAFRGKQLQGLYGFVKKHSDATLEEIREYFASRVNWSIVAIHNTLKRLGWRYKKIVTSQ